MGLSTISLLLVSSGETHLPPSDMFFCMRQEKTKSKNASEV